MISRFLIFLALILSISLFWSLIKALNISNTYYNHNHLLLWNSNANKMTSIVDKLKQAKPEYIIESKTIEDFLFPEDEIKDNYKLVYDNNKTKVYKSYEKNRSN